MLGEGPQASEQRREVLSEYGSWLAEQNRQEDAAVAFLAAGKLDAALLQYSEGGHWQMALAVAGTLSFECLHQQSDLVPCDVQNHDWILAQDLLLFPALAGKERGFLHFLLIRGAEGFLGESLVRQACPAYSRVQQLL